MLHAHIIGRMTFLVELLIEIACWLLVEVAIYLATLAVRAVLAAILWHCDFLDRIARRMGYEDEDSPSSY